MFCSNSCVLCLSRASSFSDSVAATGGDPARLLTNSRSLPASKSLSSFANSSASARNSVGGSVLNCAAKCSAVSAPSLACSAVGDSKPVKLGPVARYHRNSLAAVMT